MKPKFRSLIAAFAPLSRSSLIVVASLCAATNGNADQTWNGSISTDWNTVANWTSAVPSTGDVAIFDATSTANLGTLLSYNSSVAGIRVVDPGAPVSLGTAANTSLAPWAAVNVDDATETITYTVTPITPLANNDRVAFTATTLPAGLVVGTTYYVVSASGTNFKVSATLGGQPVNITGSGTAVSVNGVTLLTNATDTFAYASQFGLASPLANGNIVSFAASTGPTGMILGRHYFVVNATASTYQVSETLGGPVVDFTTDGVNLRGTGINSPFVTLGASGVAMGTATQDLTISAPSYLGAAQTWDVPTGRLLTVSGPLVGPGGITKTGAGNMVFGNVANTYAGGTTLNAGAVTLGSGTAASAANLGLAGTTITLAGGTITNGTGGSNGSVGLNNNFVVNADSTINMGNRMGLGGGATLRTITGNAKLTINAGTAVSRDDISANCNSYAGTLSFAGSGGVRLMYNPGNFGGMSAATVELNGSASLSPATNSGGNTVGIGKLTGTSATGLGVHNTGGAPTYSIGGLGLDSTYDGGIVGSNNITKVGSGTLTLTSTTALTYTGATTITEGSLKINGVKIGAGATTVNGTGTTGRLTGTGSVAGTTTVASGGHLAPGDDLVASGIGTITHTNLTLPPGGVVDLEFGPGVNDKITMATGGTLTLSPGVKINAYDGTVAGGVSFGTNGTYPIINVAGATVSGFNSSTFVVDNAVPGKVYSFTNDGTVISLVVSDSDPSNYWNPDGGGAWNTAGNWTKNLVPNAPGANAKIGPGPGGLGFFGASVPIDLNAVQTVGEIVFNLDSFDYNISINPGTAGSLLMDNNTVPSNIVVVKGDHFIDAPVAVDGQGLNIDIADIPAVLPSVPTPFNLTVSGVISGTGAGLLKSGPGTLVLTGDNTYDGGTSLSGGKIRINSLTSLGAATVAATFTGGTLQLANDLAADARPFIASGTSSVLIDTNGFNYTYGGTVSTASGGTGGLQKLSPGTMTITTAQAYTGTTTVGKPPTTDTATPPNTTTYPGGVLEVAAGGTINGGAVVVNSGTSKMLVSGGSLAPGGVVTVTGSVLEVSAGSLAPGGLVTVTGSVLEVSGGSAVLNSGLNGNTGNPSSNIFLNLTGGTFSSSFVSMGRSAAAITNPLLNGAPTTSGLYVNGATATISGLLNVGLNNTGTNSTASARIDSGSLTVDGVVSISIASPDRWSVMDVNGGTFTSTNAATGVQIGSGQGGSVAFLVRNGVATVERFLLQQPTASTRTSLLNVSGGTLYIGAGGIVGNNNGGTGVLDVQLGTATLGAKAAWSTLLGATLNGTTTIKAADALAAPFDISIAGVLSGTGGFDKTGTGKLTLSGLNTYTGNTTVSAGTLEVTHDDVFDDASTVTIVSGATLNLTHSGTDKVGVLVVNGSTLADGTYTFGAGKLQVGAATSTPFETWALSKGLDGTAGKENGMNDDPDKDGKSNLSEFAFNGNPLSGSDNGQIYVLTADSDADSPDTTKELILTLAVRKTTPAFTAGAPATAPLTDGINYSIQGSTNLASFGVTVTPVGFVDPGVALTDAVNYEYRSFSLSGSNGLAGKGFLRANAVAP